LTSASLTKKRQGIDFSAYTAQPTLSHVAAPAGFVSVASTVSYDVAAVAVSAAADITTNLSVSAAVSATANKRPLTM